MAQLVFQLFGSFSATLRLVVDFEYEFRVKYNQCSIATFIFEGLIIKAILKLYKWDKIQSANSKYLSHLFVACIKREWMFTEEVVASFPSRTLPDTLLSFLLVSLPATKHLSRLVGSCIKLMPKFEAA